MRNSAPIHPLHLELETAIYNAASELTTVTYKQGTTTLGPLTYTYDLAGNRIKTGGTFARSNLPPALTTTNYNANNQQTTFGTTTETYDLNGNLATSTDAGVVTTYTWNARNQLTGISKTGFTASFMYDSFGRRTGKAINGTTTNFVYDRLNPVQEKAGATVNANLLTGLGIDGFFTRTDGVGTRVLLTDALGSTVALGDGTGTLQTQYTYEPFGFVSQTGAASTSSYKFTGREDDGSGLYYYRARYYQPRFQRFISEDPIRFRGGINLYGYVRNNPIKQTDPTGLGPKSFITCSILNGVKSVNDFRRYLALLDENTAMTFDLLIRVQSEISNCPSSDTERLVVLEELRRQLSSQLAQLQSDHAGDISMTGLLQASEAMAAEGFCAMIGILEP